MKKFLALGLVLVAAVSFSSCKTAEKYKTLNSKADTWLAAQTQPSRANFSGSWHANDWGHVELKQNGRNVTGRIGSFDVRGVVSDDNLYLAISENGWVYYTAKLDYVNRNLAEGYYSYSVPFSREDMSQITLRRSEF